jgi:cephalosporin-C deacetylase-like acetyl esterase
MRFFLWVPFLALFLSAQPASAQPKKTPPPLPPAALALRAERAEAVYNLDEPAAFLFATNQPGEIVYRFSEEGFSTIKEGKLSVQAQKTYRLDHKLDRPGFLRLDLEQNGGKAFAVAGVAPTKIMPVSKAPADFEEFWAKQLKELAAVKVDSDLDYVSTKCTPLVNVFRVNLGFIDNRRVHGWLGVPKNNPGPFPVILTLPHAGVYRIDEPDYENTKLGALTLHITIHDIVPDAPHVLYEKAEKKLRDYRVKGWEDPEKTYFRYAVLAGVRALDYMTSRKDFNGTEVAVTGISQGGGLALILSGLDPRVTLLAPNIAGMCELDARAHGRIDGWPHWLASAPDDLKAKIQRTAGYYDAVHFAKKFKGKSLHGVGFLDVACPPSTVYAAFNVQPDPKRMIDSPLLAHTTDPRWLAARTEFFKENLTLKAPFEKR